eukprot:COSAG01_NODE_68311_length_264_cov_0.939394_1_plen_71_part_10
MRLLERAAALLALSSAAAHATRPGSGGGGGGGSSSSSSSRPCDIYAAGGTPCVAAHSTVRALYASYTGMLY